MRPLLNFKILIVGFFLLYTNLHHVPAFQIICKDKPLILSLWYNLVQVCKQLEGMATGILRGSLDQRLLLHVCPYGGWSSNSFLILDSFLTPLSVWSTSCLLFFCSKDWRNYLPARHISCKKKSELSFISLKRGGVVRVKSLWSTTSKGSKEPRQLFNHNGFLLSCIFCSSESSFSCQKASQVR